MPISDPDLWRRVETWPLPFRDEIDKSVTPHRRCQTFADNLRKDGDWTEVSATRLVGEYRRFLYLKALRDGPLTPPEPIDSAWHLHLSMGPDFEDGFCRAIGRTITHQTGLSDEASQVAYDHGRAMYKTEFDVEPPADIWPGPDRRRLALIGRIISFSGLAVFGLGCFLNLSQKGPLDYAMLIGGLLMFLGGAVLASLTEPARVSRCA